MAKTYWATFGSGVPSSNSGLAPTFIQFWNASGATLTPPSIAEIGSSSGLYKFAYTPTISIGFVLDGATTGLASNVRYVLGSLDPIDRVDEQLNTDIAFGFATGSSLNAIGASIRVMGASLSVMGTTLLGIGSTIFGIGATVTQNGINILNLGTTFGGFGSTLTGIGVTVTGIGNTLSGLGISFSAFTPLIGTTGSTFGGTGTDPLDLFGYLKRTQEFLEGNDDFSKSAGTWDIYSRGSSTLLRTKTLTNDSVGVTKI